MNMNNSCPLRQPAGNVEQRILTFATITADLLALDEWLRMQDVKVVAIKSTAVYAHSHLFVDGRPHYVFDKHATHPILHVVSVYDTAETIASTSRKFTRGFVGKLTKCLATSSARGQEPAT